MLLLGLKLEGMVGGGRDKRERRDLERRVGRWRERERGVGGRRSFSFWVFYCICVRGNKWVELQEFVLNLTATIEI